MHKRPRAVVRMTLVLLVLQAVIALAIAVALREFDLPDSTPAALACGVGAVLLVRLAINMNNFVISGRAASATPAGLRLGPMGWARLLAEEFVASMLQTFWFMPRAGAHQRIYPNSPVAPVLLLHGYGCNSGYWAHLAPLLDQRKISHATLDMEPVTAGIDDFVPLVERALADLCRASNAPAAVIIGHSMGGLVARAYLRAHGAARVAHVITIASPHHGSTLARLGPGLNARQMRRDHVARHDHAAPQDRIEEHASGWLRELGASENAATRALITSIYTHHDNMVAPQTSSQLSGAHNIAFGGVGHVAMGRNRRILACVLQELSKVASRTNCV